MASTPHPPPRPQPPKPSPTPPPTPAARTSHLEGHIEGTVVEDRPPDTDKRRPPPELEREKKPEAEKKAAPKEGKSGHPILPPGQAESLFKNGHKIAKDGDPPSKWISMGRLGDGTAVMQTAMTAEIKAEIEAGSYYLADGLVDEAEPSGPPTNVDVPHVTATGALANCTMGNWTGSPTSYAYAWQRDGAPIAGATSADYTMVAADSGKQIGCIVSAANAAGGPVAAPLSNTVVGP
jgi:hypothetical protein